LPKRRRASSLPARMAVGVSYRRPWATSPIAYISLMSVVSSSLQIILPLVEVFIPIYERFRPLVSAERPIAKRTVSKESEKVF
jgi:hypothetical protein